MAAGSAEDEEESDRLFSALWSPIGAATVKAARLRPGAHVLDAWCGPGASAIQAAEHVGPLGVVDAVDLAESSLERGRARAEAHGVANVRFLRGDVSDWPAPPGGYDAVLCALGVSSFPDAAAGTERLLSLMRPGGRLTTAVWSRTALDPLTEALRQALPPERPGAAGAPPPADPLRHLGSLRSLRDWLAARSLSFVEARYVPLALPADPGLLWTLTHTRFGGLLDGLPVHAVERVRRRFTERLLAEGRDTIDASALVGTGTVRRVARPRRPRGVRPLQTAYRPTGSAPRLPTPPPPASSTA
ncbi:class I SAM-dependent methyltransferase [Streptomyces fradiae]|uniref:class I SAM-dependent methyltransferase n=1 Tax=Streptomyces fradiae TaxID=1906 RepID=UPI0039875AD0